MSRPRETNQYTSAEQLLEAANGCSECSAAIATYAEFRLSLSSPRGETRCRSQSANHVVPHGNEEGTSEASTLSLDTRAMRVDVATARVSTLWGRPYEAAGVFRNCAVAWTERIPHYISI